MQFVTADDVGDGVSSGQLHFVADALGAGIQQAAEEPGKAEHVVQLIGEITAAGADDASHIQNLLSIDLRFGLRDGKDNRRHVHGRDVFRLDAAAASKADAHIGAL